jgi:hypothetical protein
MKAQEKSRPSMKSATKMLPIRRIDWIEMLFFSVNSTQNAIIDL